jgi:uncharacterized cupredoxin-like copper-binding protein
VHILRLPAVAAALAATIVLTGCGGSRTAAGQTATIVERDFRISAPARVHAGPITLHVDNKGPDDHELIVVPLHGAPLPLRPDGLTVDEEAVQASEPGHLEPGLPGAKRDLHVVLKPGRYVLFCNMSGHYLGGMHTVLVVTR